MGVHQTAYCPNCGALSFRCQCGVAQPVGAYPGNQMGTQGPQRPFIQAPPQGARMMRPAQVRQAQVQHMLGQVPVDALLGIPSVAERVNQILAERVNAAVAEVQAQMPAQTYDPPAVEGVPAELVDALYRVPLEAIPGAAPATNAGGRQNLYAQARREVFEFFQNKLRDMVKSVLPSEGEPGRV